MEIEKGMIVSIKESTEQSLSYSIGKIGKVVKVSPPFVYVKTNNRMVGVLLYLVSPITPNLIPDQG